MILYTNEPTDNSANVFNNQHVDLGTDVLYLPCLFLVEQNLEGDRTRQTDEIRVAFSVETQQNNVVVASDLSDIKSLDLDFPRVNGVLQIVVALEIAIATFEGSAQLSFAWLDTSLWSQHELDFLVSDFQRTDSAPRWFWE